LQFNYNWNFFVLQYLLAINFNFDKIDFICRNFVAIETGPSI